MCKAFSGIITKNGDVLWKFGVDSHDEIVSEFKLQDTVAERDRLPFARFEVAPANGNYLSPDRWVFRLDEQIKPGWFSDKGGWYKGECMRAHKKWLAKLNRIIIRKPIINPLKDIAPPKKITKKHIDLFKTWASVTASVRASVGASVRASVWASVWDSVRDSVGASVWASVGASVWASVGDSVGDSVLASVWAYVGSFFTLPRKGWKYTDKIKTKVYPFQSAVDLWMMGLVPSFDGKTWRLHAGPKAEVVYELKEK